MTRTAAVVIEEFKALSDQDREEVLAALLAEALSRPYCSPADEELAGSAEQVFLDLEDREKR